MVSKGRCPQCAKQGKDQSKDNLAVYSDGHSYCYSCGYHSGLGLVSRFRQRSISTGKLDKPESKLCLPEDCDVIYPERALDWVKQYELTKVDLLNHNTLWSESTQRLIFPVFGDTGLGSSACGVLLAYQGRYFGPAAPEGSRSYPKWHGQGNLKDTYNILGEDSSKIVLCEDIISAIKMSKITRVMPLYGSHVGIDRFKRLRMLIEPSAEVWIYLDPDKRKESVVEARRGVLCGMKTRVIYSEADPKEESYESLQRILK